MLAQILDHRIVVGRKRERRLHDGLERWRQLEVRMIRSLTARGERRRDGFRKIVRLQNLGHAVAISETILHPRDELGHRVFPLLRGRSEEHTSDLTSLMRTSYA